MTTTTMNQPQQKMEDYHICIGTRVRISELCKVCRTDLARNNMYRNTKINEKKRRAGEMLEELEEMQTMPQRQQESNEQEEEKERENLEIKIKNKLGVSWIKWSPLSGDEYPGEYFRKGQRPHYGNCSACYRGGPFGEKCNNPECKGEGRCPFIVVKVRTGEYVNPVLISRMAGHKTMQEGNLSTDSNSVTRVWEFHPCGSDIEMIREKLREDGLGWYHIETAIRK